MNMPSGFETLILKIFTIVIITETGQHECITIVFHVVGLVALSYIRPVRYHQQIFANIKWFYHSRNYREKRRGLISRQLV